MEWYPRSVEHRGESKLTTGGPVGQMRDFTCEFWKCPAQVTLDEAISGSLGERAGDEGIQASEPPRPDSGSPEAPPQTPCKRVHRPTAAPMQTYRVDDAAPDGGSCATPMKARLREKGVIVSESASIGALRKPVAACFRLPGRSKTWSPFALACRGRSSSPDRGNGDDQARDTFSAASWGHKGGCRPASSHFRNLFSTEPGGCADAEDSLQDEPDGEPEVRHHALAYQSLDVASTPRTVQDAAHALGVSPNCSVSELQQVYTQAVRHWHTDQHNVSTSRERIRIRATEALRRVKVAYDILQPVACEE